MRSFVRWLALLLLGFGTVTLVEGANPPPRRPNPSTTQQQRINQQRQRQQQMQQQQQQAWRQAQYRSQLARLNMAGVNAPVTAFRPPFANPYAGMPGYGTPGAANNPAGTPAAGSYADYMFLPLDDVTVRRFRLPTVDEEGKPKKYSPEELKELKGDNPSLIGYNATYDELKIGQTCRVTIARKRTDPADPDKVTWVTVGQATGKIVKLDDTSLKQLVLRVATQPTIGGQKKGNNEVPADPNKALTMIVILSEPAASNPLAAKN